MRSIFLFLIWLSVSLSLQAVNVGQLKQQADKAYSQEHYEQARDLYLQISQEGDDAAVYYNLGNCYFRLDDIAHAILWYERAQLLDPSDEDVRSNLAFAQTKTIDKIVPEQDIFFVRWYYSLLNSCSSTGWTIRGIIAFALMLGCLLVYIFSTTLSLRKLGFFAAVFLFFAVVLTNIFAWHLDRLQKIRDRAVITDASVTVKSTPSETGKDLLLLHAGTTMQIIDSTMSTWIQIRLSNGKEGWIPVKSVEKI